MKERPGVKKNQAQCLHEPSVVPLFLENWLQIIVYLWKQLQHWENTMFLEHWHMNTLYFVNVWFQKLKYLYPLHGRLFDLHPPPPGFSVPGGFWWPPSPQEFPEFLNGDFAYLPGYQRFFSRAAGIFSVGQRPTHLRPEYRLPSFKNSKWFW